MSREATTASAQLAATCIHTLQAGQLTPEMQSQLRQQVAELLETALAVGEQQRRGLCRLCVHLTATSSMWLAHGRIWHMPTPGPTN